MSTGKLQAIIFDLGGVLIVEPETVLIKELPDHLIDVYQQNNGKVFNRIFEFTQHVYGQDFKRLWFMGTMSANDIVQKIDHALENPIHENFFKTKEEKELIAFGARMVLLPHNIEKLSALHQEGIEFVKQCRQQGIKTLILSNWDPKSFSLIQAKFPELFELFEDQDIFIPSTVGFIKPDAEIFAHIMRVTNTNADQLTFIDDGLGNVAKAREMGLNAILHMDWQKTTQCIKKDEL